MPKIAKELTSLQVKRLTKAGMHSVGGVPGLLLQVRSRSNSDSPTSRSWILRTRLPGKRIHMGLGSYPTVGLAEAREMARKKILECREGLNPIEKRKAERSQQIAHQARSKTFKECARDYLETHLREFSNEKHRKQWVSTLENYVYPTLGARLVSSITMADILSVLEQKVTNLKTQEPVGRFWEAKTETAKRVQGRIKSILDYAIVKEYRTGSNPALWDGVLSTQLASPKKITSAKHHTAVPYAEAPSFLRKLRQSTSLSARALEFLILTAVRSGSVRLATWGEIDLEKRLWTIPAEHTKSREGHRVPLSAGALEVLENCPRLDQTRLVFPSANNKPLSDMALSQLMRGMYDRGEMKQKAVPHGWRSTFRDWAAEMTEYSDEVRKVASGHSVEDAVKAAYQRTDLLEKRRGLMEDWSHFLNGPKPQRVRSVRRLKER